MHVLNSVESCLRRLQGVSPARSVLVAFSGGPDSTALLDALAKISGDFETAVFAAHLDHGLDEDSAARARQATAIAERLGVPITLGRVPIDRHRKPGESREAAARRVRYGFLEKTADQVGAKWIATAHHADDQRETVLLRMSFGSGLAGLAGIPWRRGRIVRPLLEVDRSQIDRYLRTLDIVPVDDPSNQELDIPRNLIRHRLLPALRREDESIDRRLISLSGAATSARQSLDRLLLEAVQPEVTSGSARFERSNLERLPEELRLFSVGSLCRLISAPPPTRAALSNLAEQMARGGRVGCDLGSGWMLSGRHSLRLARRPALTAPFAYTLRVPGEILLPEVSLVFRLTRKSVEPWMFRGSRWRAGLSLSLKEGSAVQIRNRRPGDRLQPLGCRYTRRLKDVLIDHKIPRHERNRLPLLCIDERIVWIPGVTIDESARLYEEARAWVAELEPHQGSTE